MIHFVYQSYVTGHLGATLRAPPATPAFNREMRETQSSSLQPDVNVETAGLAWS